MNVFPRISVVTPSFNQAPFIRDTIESVLSQRYPNIEYIIIDGGSTDGSVQIIDEYRDRLAYFVSEKDRGQAHAVNKGFAVATGEIICWLNSDDLFIDGALKSVMELFTAEKFDFCYGDGFVFKHGVPERKYWVRPGSVTLERLCYQDPLLQPSTFWSRRVLDQIGGLNEALHFTLDWEFFIRISQRFPLRYLPVALSAYRIHPTHKSGSGNPRRIAEIFQMMETYAAPRWVDVYRDVAPLCHNIVTLRSRWRRFYRVAFCIQHWRLLHRYSVSEVVTALEIL